MTKDEALKLALEELLIYQLLVDSEWGSCRSNKQIEIDGDTNPGITAIKEALAQPSDSVEQEPEGDYAPNHFCNGAFVHKPTGELCNKCGKENT